MTGTARAPANPEVAAYLNGARDQLDAAVARRDGPAITVIIAAIRDAGHPDVADALFDGAVDAMRLPTAG